MNPSTRLYPEFELDAEGLDSNVKQLALGNVI